MAINKSLNIGLKKAHKKGDWVGFDALKVGSVSDYGGSEEIRNKIIELMKIDGFKINQSINDDKLTKDLKFVKDYAKSEGDKSSKTNQNKNRADFHNQMLMFQSLTVIADLMAEELRLRDAVNTQISKAKEDGSLESWLLLKDLGRTNEQIKLIQDNLTKIQNDIKAKDALAQKTKSEKQAKLDSLNKQMAGAKTQKEKEAIASQISDLMGTVSEQTGMPKSYLYIGIGVAVVVGIWITLRAIRK